MTSKMISNQYDVESDVKNIFKLVNQDQITEKGYKNLLGVES